MSPRFLAESTVIRAFLRRGWSCETKEGVLVAVSFISNRPGGTIFGTVDEGFIKLGNARMIRWPNVHIVSYWGPFRSMAELRKSLHDIERLYTETCGTQFGGSDG